MSESLKTRFYSFRNQYRELLRSDPRIRNRLLAILILLGLLTTLIVFNIQQGFAGFEEGESRLILFIAVNINIVLLAIVFYLIARNLLKLVYERKQHVLGVNLKTKLIISFIILSLPAMGFHLFASIFIANNLESWLEGQHQAVLHQSRSVSEALHSNLRKNLELQGWLWQTEMVRNKTIAPEGFQIPPSEAGITIYKDPEAIVFQRFSPNFSEELWTPLSQEQWLRFQKQEQLWLAEERPGQNFFRHLRRVSIGEQEVVLEVFQPTLKYNPGGFREMAEMQLNSLFFSESRELVQRYFLVIFLLMLLFIIFVATWIAFYLAQGFVQPIEDLSQATQRVSEGQLGYQVALRGPLDKDFGLLVNSFNTMSRELKENRMALIKTTDFLKQSKKVLEEHTRFVELVLENITTGVISMDIDGRVEGINRSAKELLQLQTTNFSGKHFQEVLSSDSLRILQEMTEELQQEQKQFVSRNLNLVKNSAPVMVSASLLLLKNRDGRPVGMISIFNNITEMQRLERARAWREVARRIAHEIKNPLTPIQLSAERIRRKYAPQVSDQEALIQSTETIVNEVQQLEKMVSEFSKFARIPESNPQPDDLNEVIEETLNLYHDNLPSRIQLKTELGDDIPRISLDREQIKRVFINLIDNAIDAIEKKGHLSRLFRQGEIMVRSRFLPDLGIVQAEVQDNGAGIDAEKSSQLFDPYTTTKDHGTGLGLTIVSQTVTDHQGFVRFSSGEGGGAIFTIELPVM